MPAPQSVLRSTLVLVLRLVCAAEPAPLFSPQRFVLHGLEAAFIVLGKFVVADLLGTGLVSTQVSLRILGERMGRATE